MVRYNKKDHLQSPKFSGLENHNKYLSYLSIHSHTFISQKKSKSAASHTQVVQTTTIPYRLTVSEPAVHKGNSAKP